MKVAVLPCNGLDKTHGAIARELALLLVEADGGELICPVLLNNSPERYAKSLDHLPLLVIDGCATRCATKLAGRLEHKISHRIQIGEELERLGAHAGHSLILSREDEELARQIVAQWKANLEEKPTAPEAATVGFQAPRDFVEVTHDKFLFKVPAAGFFFNENDVWVQVSGTRARIGVSDLCQQQMTDITFCQPAEVGKQIEQFGEAGYIESAKATLELVSPVSGNVVAINPALASAPETINQDPYGEGWIVELELRDFAADRELLIDGAAYTEVVRRKAAES